VDHGERFRGRISLRLLALEAAARDIGIRPLAGSGEADPESLAAVRELAFDEFEVGARRDLVVPVNVSTSRGLPPGKAA
jgi:hypothetical protein